MAQRQRLDWPSAGQRPPPVLPRDRGDVLGVVIPTEPGTPPGRPPEIAPPAGMVGTLGPLFRLIKDQRVAFLIVGGANTVIGLAWFALFDALWSGVTLGYIWALLCAHVASVLCAFVLYRTLVFRVRGHVWLDLARFEVVNLTALGVNLLILPILVSGLGMRPLVGQVLITFVTMLISFFGHKLFSFRRPPESPVADGSPTGH